MDKPNQPIPDGADAPLPGARQALILLLAINLFNYIDRYVLAAVVPEIQREFKGSTDAEIGFLSTAFLVSYMVAAPLFGWLADRYSRWLLISAGVIVWSLASGASGLATGIGMMLATRLFVGIGEAAYGPAAPTIISDLYPVSRRGSVLAWFYAAIPVGSALGFLLGGQVLAAGGSWHHAFFIVVPPGIALGIWAFLMRDPQRGASDAAADGKPAESLSLGAIGEYKAILRVPSYLLNTAGMTAMTFATGGLAFWMPKYIVWRQAQAGLLDMNDAEAAKAAAASASSLIGPITVVAGLSATILGGIAGDKLRTRLPGSYFIVSGLGMLIGFPAFLGMMWVPFPAAWGLFFLACFCVFFNTGPSNTALANVTHPSMRAAAFALNIFIIHAAGDAISPLVIGWINDSTGGNMNAGFFAVSLAMLVSGVFWLWGAKHLQRDTEAALKPPGLPAYPVGTATTPPAA